MAHKQYLKMADVFVHDDVAWLEQYIYAGYMPMSCCEYAAHAINSHDELVAENERMRELLEAAKAVVARWDTPNWKDAEPTAAVIGRLRAVISKCGGSAS